MSEMKTLNGYEIVDESARERIAALENESGNTVQIVQTTGTSTTKVMSQKAVTDAIAAAISGGKTISQVKLIRPFSAANYYVEMIANESIYFPLYMETDEIPSSRIPSILKWVNEGDNVTLEIADSDTTNASITISRPSESTIKITNYDFANTEYSGDGVDVTIRRGSGAIYWCILDENNEIIDRVEASANIIYASKPAEDVEDRNENDIYSIVYSDGSNTLFGVVPDGSGRGVISFAHLASYDDYDAYDILYTDGSRQEIEIPHAKGVTFTPHVSADGVLSWTNDGGLTNPDPVNIVANAEGIGEIVQIIGNSETAVMSQKAVTDEMYSEVPLTWELGSITANGIEYDATNICRTVEYIDVKCISHILTTSPKNIFMYDELQRYLSYVSIEANANLSNADIYALHDNIGYIRIRSNWEETPSTVIDTVKVFEDISAKIALKQIDKVADDVDEIFNTIGNPYTTYTEEIITTATTKALDIEYPMIDGKQYEVVLDSYTGKKLNRVELYLANSGTDYQTIKNDVAIGESIVFTGVSKYKYIRFYAILTENESETSVLTVKFAPYDENSLSVRVRNLEQFVHKEGPNVLIIGDSYSQSGRWINALKTMVGIGNVVNLGVSSATLKDKYEDRTTYPYNSKPVSNDTRGGNVNTFGSQIEKLKRLMSGEDLETGEIKIYTTESEYPNIILIEGGTNDSVDASTDNYVNQVYTAVNGYYKWRSQDNATEGSIKIPTPYENTNRTTFGGAMRYLYGVLHEMFPNALIFFITPCGLSYLQGNNFNYLEKCEQIKYAASLLGTPVIDWGSNGRLTFCDNAVSGIGTTDDPYIVDTPGEYSTDALHPNDKGARLLAMEVAKVLHSYNLVSYLT